MFNPDAEAMPPILDWSAAAVMRAGDGRGGDRNGISRYAFGGAMILAALCAASGCAPGARLAAEMAQNAPQPAAHDAAQPIAMVGALTRDLHTVDDLLAALGPRRAYVIGEAHDNYAHHLAQRDVIQALQADGAPLAIGVEFIQRPFQSVLDDYVAQRIDEAEMLKRSDYFNRWGFDFRLYRPIFRYAREQGLPLIALHAATALSVAVRTQDYEQLPEAQRARLPAFKVAPSASYRQRLRDVFARHPQRVRGIDAARQAARFAGFVRVQQLWDAVMAETAANYLKRHPGHRIVVLAGQGHVSWPGAIVDRMRARLPAAAAGHSPVVGIELHQSPIAQSGHADALLMPAPVTLPSAGRLGIYMAQTDLGVRIEALPVDSAAAAAGLRQGDILHALNGQRIAAMADVRIVLLDKRPGDVVRLAVRRAGQARTVHVTLAASDALTAAPESAP